MKHYLIHFIRIVAFAMVSLTLVSCGGGGYAPTLRTPLRTLPANFSELKAIAYSPYRNAEKGELPSPEQDLREDIVVADLQKLQQSGFQLIRLYSSRHVGELILKVISENKLGLKVMLGANLAKEMASEEDKQAAVQNNLLELQSAIDLAKRYSGIVVAVSVGNENLKNQSSNAIDPAQMVRYLKMVRNGIVQPVTTSDDWAFYANEASYDGGTKKMEYQMNMPNLVLSAVDFVSIHTYPMWDAVATFNAPIGELWDWRQTGVPEQQRAAAMMDAAVAVLDTHYEKTRAYLDARELSHMPIIVGETGWKSSGEDFKDHNVTVYRALSFMASTANQAMYREKVQSWQEKNGVNVVWFSSFDEPWKQQYTTGGSTVFGDDYFGIFDSNAVEKVSGTSVSWVDLNAAKQISKHSQGEWQVFPVVTQNTIIPITWDKSVGEVDSSGVWTISPVADQNWGWGASLLADDPSHTESGDALHDVADMYATGTLKFRVKTTYSGSLCVGAITNNRDALESQNCIALTSGKYGFVNSGQWVDVSIPLKEFLQNSNWVLHPFMIAGFQSGLGTALPKIYIEKVSYSPTGQ
ncbi:glycosyl hydrolase family 17 protein [Candidatus Symbiobacter mobilis]|uniref:Endo-1,3-beta-glucanase btgC n=1 Tax=Candidatus Symbiobacter mobilis CR TaxID=946483 RepID=U5N8G9_9BURK|nr:glycosyl hydrolase family 17 protein [Candidatus Symbiobacter mobilis]AGX87702.1 exo-beta-1,3-glucanase [Candidatus Symbiobacter mobilis CR]